MTTVRRALALSFLERYLSIVLALASNMILARLLTPHEIGQYSVTLAVIGVAQVLRDFGIGNYLIQEKELTDQHLGTAFALSLMLGGTLALGVFALAPLAASFYGEPAMATTMRIAAINFLILPFCTVRLALLRRAMRFKALLYVSLAGTLVGITVTVLLAFLGWGADSMAAGAVAQNLATALGTWLAHEDRRLHRPTLALWRPLLNFGGQSALTNVVTTVSMDANDLVVGKVLGFEPVAMLSRGQGLVNLFQRDVIGAVRNVALPALAQSFRQNEDVNAKFRHWVSTLALIGWPFFGWLALYSLEALRLLFGPQWDQAAAIVPVLCLAGALGILNCLVPNLLVAVGRIELLTKIELVLQPTRLALIIAAALIFRSIEAVAVALLIVGLLAAPSFLWVASLALPGLTRGLARALAGSALITGFALAPALVHVMFWERDTAETMALPGVLAAVIMGLGLALAAAHLFRHPITMEPVYVRLVGRLWARESPDGRK
jgi:O-antigen/teichoic acid export membrane protein